MRRATPVLLLALALATGVARAGTAGDAATIRAAIMGWQADFNARKAVHRCALFTPDLRYDFRGFPERGHKDICTLPHRSLADKRRHFAYSADIKEVLVSGDLAVARLVWTLRATIPGAAKQEISTEPGMDVFRRFPDRSWKIIRYIAYEAPATHAASSR
ncbi:MAG TPA: nuclear transport factor 2 family protein [Acetobacteraceae bacterium]|nr:nuclear transport factor 2 family protein [Acetobacteraceae bacterium]